MAFKLRMKVDMHCIQPHTRFDDLDLDFENAWKARPSCLLVFFWLFLRQLFIVQHFVLLKGRGLDISHCYQWMNEYLYGANPQHSSKCLTHTNQTNTNTILIQNHPYILTVPWPNYVNAKLIQTYLYIQTYNSAQI